MEAFWTRFLPAIQASKFCQAPVFAGGICVVLALLWRRQGYTCLAMSSVALFFLSNAVLTRGTIPVEDFFYNLSYIGLVLTVYLLMKRVMGL